MPIGFFPHLQSLMRNGQQGQGQQMPDPAQYANANQTPLNSYFARKTAQPGGLTAQPGGATMGQQAFNQAQSMMNQGSPGGRMNRRRF